MDVLTDVLRTITPTNGGFGRRDLQSPWVISVPAIDLAIVHIVVRGECWVSVDGAEPIELREGNVVLLPHGHPHRIASDADAAGPLQPRSCSLAEMAPPGAGDATLTCGFFGIEGRLTHPLLSELPRVVHVAKGNAGRWLETTIDMIAQHASGPGAEILLDQLAGLLLTQILRFHVDGLDSEADGGASEHGWLGGLRDPAIGAALKRIHREPARPWTVAALARESAVSRSAFAARFRALVGQSPLAYVTRWRMHLAAHLLRTKGPSVEECCHQVGYRSVATFAKAFKRSIGLPPAAYRRSSVRAPLMPAGDIRTRLLGARAEE